MSSLSPTNIPHNADDTKSVAVYKQQLETVVAAGGLVQHVSDGWKTLVPLISSDVLKDAHRQIGAIQALFKELGPKLLARREKTAERIATKKQGSQPDIAFKVNCDLTAFRLHVHPSDITSTVERVAELVSENHGVIYVRNSIITENGKLSDIVQYVYVYLPAIGYVTELQIGHEFASWTFTRDSARRDLRLAGKEVGELVNFWTHAPDTPWTDCFYVKMRAKILDPSSSTFDVRQGLSQAFGQQPVDAELLRILQPYLTNEDLAGGDASSDASVLSMDEIVPHLFQGSQLAGEPDAVAKHNIRTVINCAAIDFKYTYPTDSKVRLLNLDWSDELDCSVFATNPNIVDAFRLMKESIERKENVLVQCYHGKSRSSTLTAFYLVKVHGMTLPEALKHIQARRWIARPREHFVQQLQEYCDSEL
jgi:predicted protein tyrosine phosphatase